MVDPSSFQSWDIRPAQSPARPAYANELPAAEKGSGSDEAVVTGEGLLHGKRIAIIAGEFGFPGGSVGAAAAQLLISALERATMEGLPRLASPASGGTRMQEGTKAFLSMVGITAAVQRHKTAGSLNIVYLWRPTTGGAMAS